MRRRRRPCLYVPEEASPLPEEAASVPEEAAPVWRRRPRPRGGSAGGMRRPHPRGGKRRGGGRRRRTRRRCSIGGGGTGTALEVAALEEAAFVSHCR